MKLTPLDIHHKEFAHSLRGYNVEQVDRFLDEVADEFERLFKENIAQSEKIDVSLGKINEFDLQRNTINNTLMAAQRSADDILAKANTDAEGVLRDAEFKAKEIIHNALAKKQQVAAELVRIKQAEEEFRARFRELLETNLRSVAEIALPADVDVLLGDTEEGAVGDVVVRLPDRPVASAAPVAMPPLATPQLALEPEVASLAAAQPPSPGFVQSVALGEIGGPDLPDELTFIEPGEFALPSLNALGERDDDVDIEEID